jgi:hypothetical protein
MSNYDDLKHREESAAYNRDLAERLTLRRSEMWAKGESTNNIDDEIRRAERQAAKDEEIAMKMRAWMGAGAPPPSDPTSPGRIAHRVAEEMEQAMRDIRRARNERDY